MIHSLLLVLGVLSLRAWCAVTLDELVLLMDVLLTILSVDGRPAN